MYMIEEGGDALFFYLAGPWNARLDGTAHSIIHHSVDPVP